jgi:quercetin dioxygenase-like cupin family protein
MYPNGYPNQDWLTSTVPLSGSFEHVDTEEPVDAGRQTKGVDMAHIGETIEHPLTGERLTFLETAATTGGELLKVSLEMPPGGFLPRPHAHPRAEERFEVATGRVEIKTSGKSRIAEPGETVIVPRGAGHVWGNPFDDPATVVVTLRPALRMETFFETLFGLATDGKVSTRTQLPSFLQTVLLFHEFREECGAPGFAGTATRGLFAVLAPLARARGYHSHYSQYSAPDAP